MKTTYKRPPVPAHILKNNRLLECDETYRNGDWYGAGWGFRFEIGTDQTSIKEGDPVDGFAFCYSPCRPLSSEG